MGFTQIDTNIANIEESTLKKLKIINNFQSESLKNKLASYFIKSKNVISDSGNVLYNLSNINESIVKLNNSKISAQQIFKETPSM
jgi:hypothetical protein